MKTLCAIALSLCTLPLSYNHEYKNIALPKAEAICLADNVYHEARGEPLRGQLLVARVTLNRAQQNNESICKTVYKPYQFSWTINKPKTNRRSPTYHQAWVVAHDAYNIQYDATHFHTTKVRPYWAKHFQKIERVGNHIFYKAL